MNKADYESRCLASNRILFGLIHGFENDGPRMFSSNIGRLRFFFYSAGLLVAEIVTFVVCVLSTIGIEGLANSKPGPPREGLAAAVLVASLVIVLFRANFAWRRSRDAQGSGWIVWSYIVFSTLFA
ncbi:MAG: hypothetical protein E5W81_19955, partial [Mesorhizobium sp.]